MADPSQMPSSFDEDKEYNETGWQKVTRKLRQEPLIPLGTALTCLALYNAWRAMRRGDHEQVQRMFRARIGAQAFTVVAIVAGGAYYGADREKRAELIKLEAQQRAEERHQRWLRELEVRDQEEKDLKEAMRRRRERVEGRRAADKAADGSVKAEVGRQEEELKGKGKEGEAAQDKKEGGGGGSSVLGALSSAGGWFGTKKGGADESAAKPTEQPKKEAEPPKK
ncbi:Respiratory supercomplex factor 1, mitochondrial [Diatrype stigma]|uniref:Respiratory supercomplex factor 1, mitochondrial n=1 Tax=Diatrype stigma TaxID=117547 RepID=A0AAN9YTY4_9PEZI